MNMHVLMVVDEARMSQEGDMLNRLAVGLMSEGGAAVTRVAPRGMTCPDALWSLARTSLMPTIEYEPTIVPWRRRERTQELLRQSAEKADVLVACGRQSWPIALDMGRAASAPVIIEICVAWQFNLAPSAAHHRCIAGYTAATGALADRLRKHVSPQMVSLVPMGVPTGEARGDVLGRSDEVISMVVIGGCSDVQAYDAFLGGLALISSNYPQVQIVLELNGPDEHEVWKIARRLNLQGQVTTFRSVAAQRGLLLQCDVAALPEPGCEVRSIVLQMMAAGMPVITADNAMLDMVEHGVSGVRVLRRSAEEWAEALAKLLGDPAGARAMGLAGAVKARSAHGSMRQVQAMLETIHKVLHGESLRFAEAS